MTGARVTAIVLAGGRSQRFGSDKLAAPLGVTTVLDATLAGIPGDWLVVCVGPPRPVCRAVTWVLESPPDGGPLAGIAAGVAACTTEMVVVVAGDMPWSGPALVALATRLADAGPEVEGVVARDPLGWANPLLAAYRTAAVRAALPDSAHGRPAKLLLTLPHEELAVTGPPAQDVDTPEDLAAGGR